MTAIFFAGVVLGILSSVAQGEGERGPFAFQPSPFLRVSGVVEIFAFVCLIVWGLCTFAWYLPVGAILLGSISGFLVTDSNLGFFYRAAPVLNVTVILATTYLWAVHWPF